MARLFFFLLLIANAAFGAHLWLAAAADKADFSVRERNRDEVKLVAVTPPLIAARKAEETRQAVQQLAGSACVEFAGIPAAQAAAVRAAFDALKLGERMVERKVEEISRHWVYMPPSKDRRAAETLLAQLRKQGVTDMSIRPDQSISLGVFSSEDAARRFLVTVEGKGVRGAQSGAFSRELREVGFLIREPDTEMVARLAILQRDYPTASLRAVTCPAALAEAAKPT